MYNRKYSDEPELIKLESYAKENKLGLWGADKSKIRAPWEYRHFIRTNPKKNSNKDVNKNMNMQLKQKIEQLEKIN